MCALGFGACTEPSPGGVVIELSPQALDFPIVAPGERTTQTITVSNRGTAPSLVVLDAGGPPFSLASAEHRLLASGAVEVTVIYAPNTEGDTQARARQASCRPG